MAVVTVVTNKLIFPKKSSQFFFSFLKLKKNYQSTLLTSLFFFPKNSLVYNFFLSQKLVSNNNLSQNYFYSNPFFSSGICHQKNYFTKKLFTQTFFTNFFCSKKLNYFYHKPFSQPKLKKNCTNYLSYFFY